MKWKMFAISLQLKSIKVKSSFFCKNSLDARIQDRSTSISIGDQSWATITNDGDESDKHI